MTTNFCPQCGIQLQPGTKFCPNCGQVVGSIPPPLRDQAAPQQQTPSVQSSTGTARKKPVGVLIGIIVTAIGLLFVTCNYVIRPANMKSEYMDSFRTPGMSESTSRQLAENFIEHDLGATLQAATTIAVIAFIIGIPLLIFLMWRYSQGRSTTSNASQSQLNQPPPSNRPLSIAATPAYNSAPIKVSLEAEALLKRAFIVLEDGDWQKADELLEQTLNLDPENARAYIGKLLVKLQLTSESMLPAKVNTLGVKPLAEYKEFEKALRFADPGYRAVLVGYDPELQRNDIYEDAIAAMKSANFRYAADRFTSIQGYKDSDSLLEKCRKEIKNKEAKYNSALDAMKAAGNSDRYINYKKAAEEFALIPGYKNADDLVLECQEKLRKTEMSDTTLTIIVFLIFIGISIFIVILANQ